jgi:hypothetical protein
MYLFELITKYIMGKKYTRKSKFDPFAQDEIENPSECEHVFLPLDSTGEVLACSKCGLVVNKKDLKDENIFKNPQK